VTDRTSAPAAEPADATRTFGPPPPMPSILGSVLVESRAVLALLLSR